MPRAERRPARSDRFLARAESRAREARKRGLQEANGGRPVVAARHLRAGLRQLGWREDGEQPDAQQIPEAHQALAARLLLILAGMESEQGRTDYGLRLLDRAEGLAAADDRGLLLTQRGRLFVRTWQTAAALRALDEAVALLAGNPAETSNLASALLNRSFAYLNAGDVRRARADLIWCQQVAADGGHDRFTAKTLHNLGYCDLLAGDIPAALQLFNAAAGAYRVTAPDFLPILAMDKARALLAAGLASDAASELDAAMDSFRRQRLDYDLAEAELARAEAALAVGEPVVARRGGGRAAGRPPPRAASADRATTRASGWRNSPGCGHDLCHQAAGRRSRPKRSCSPSGCAVTAWPTTRRWRTCSRPGRCSPPDIRRT